MHQAHQAAARPKGSAELPSQSQVPDKKGETMGQPACVLAPRQPRPPLTLVPPPAPEARFPSLERADRPSRAAARGTTLAVSIGIHALLLTAALVVPLLLFDDALPATEGAVRAFFAAPPELAPAPPPPPPPPPAARAQAPRALAAPPERSSGSFAQAPAVNEHKDLGRNDPCWCGSGKKFKKCHGA